MASVYYGQNRGDNNWDDSVVQAGASTNSTDIEVRIDTSKSWTPAEAWEAAQNIMRFVISAHNTNQSWT